MRVSANVLPWLGDWVRLGHSRRSSTRIENGCRTMALPNCFDPDAYRLHPVRDPRSGAMEHFKIDSAVYWTMATTARYWLHNAADWDAHLPPDALPRSQAGRSRFSHDRLRQFKGNLDKRKIWMEDSSRETDSPVPKSEKRRWWQSKASPSWNLNRQKRALRPVVQNL